MTNKNWCFVCPAVKVLGVVVKNLTALHDKHKDKCAKREKDNK